MVHNCVAPDCRTVYNRDPNLLFHIFPHKRPEILKLWIEAVNRPNWVPSSSSRLCSKHFRKSDYLTRPHSSLRVLRLYAVPSVFKQDTEDELIELKEEPFEEIDCNFEFVEVQAEDVAIEEKTIEMETKKPKYQDAESQTQETMFSLDLRLSALHRKVDKLKAEISRKDTKIHAIKSLIKKVRKKRMLY